MLLWSTPSACRQRNASAVRCRRCRLKVLRGNLLEEFLSVHGDAARGGYPQAHLLAAYVNDHYLHFFADNDALAYLP